MLNPEELGDPPDAPLRRSTLPPVVARTREQRTVVRKRAGSVRVRLDFAAHNPVELVVAHAPLDALGRSFSDRDCRERARGQSVARTQNLMNEIDAIAERLAHEGIRLVALENAGKVDLELSGLHELPRRCGVE